jgi:AraC family transcriptional regulator
VSKRSALMSGRTINPAQRQHFWELSHSTTVILYKNDRSFLRYATLRAIRRPRCSLLSLDLKFSQPKSLAATELSMTTSSNSANAYGAQMAKYFTMNQPPHVAIDSAVSVVRPQLAITRLIARSGIPERTASIPSEKAYVVSLHLNHANSGEWELWTDDKYTKTGTVGGVAMCDLESNSSIRNPGSIDWIHYHVPRATLDSLSDDAGVPRAKRLYCVYGTPDPTLHHLTQSILPCLNKPEMFSQLFIDSFTLMICSHLVGRYAQTHEAFRQFKGGLAPWQRRRIVELFHEHLDGELKLETLANECGLSVSHFARSFRRSFGTSAHRYLILKRVEIAKALLSETNYSLVDVAAQTGFSDQAALTRTFSNVVGATPAKWRREQSRHRSFVEIPKHQFLQPHE